MTHLAEKACSKRNSFLSALPPKRVRESVLPAIDVIWKAKGSTCASWGGGQMWEGGQSVRICTNK